MQVKSNLTASGRRHAADPAWVRWTLILTAVAVLGSGYHSDARAASEDLKLPDDAPTQTFDFEGKGIEGWTTVAGQWAVEKMAGRRGARRLASAFARVRSGTDSPQETRLRLDLVDAGLPEPVVNPVIHDAAGEQIAIGDLAYPEWRVLVEYDGEHHREDRAQYARDVERLDDLARAGWRVIRFNATHTGPRRVAGPDGPA